MIKDEIDRQRQLTVHTCSGKITFEELQDAVKQLYDGEPTANHLWNLEQADVSGISVEDITRLARFAKEYAPSRRSGKTAIVSSKDLGFGMARVYEIYADLVEQTVQLKTFRALEEAYSWLDS